VLKRKVEAQTEFFPHHSSSTLPSSTQVCLKNAADSVFVSMNTE